MQEAEFDKFADEYQASLAQSTRISGLTTSYFAEYKVAEVADYVGRGGFAPASILDFGAGIGGSVPYYKSHFPSASITCLDVSSKCLELGKHLHGTAAEFLQFDGSSIPLPASHFDLAFAACVFHHIDHAEHDGLLAELFRVLNPDGYLFLFEHNRWNPLSVQVVNNCPFDENAVLVPARKLTEQIRSTGFVDVSSNYRLFFPGFLNILRPLERHLGWLPLGAQYYIVGRKPAR